MELTREKIIRLEKNIEAASPEEVVGIVSQFKGFELKGGVLGRVFEKLFVNSQGFSKSVSITELETIHHSFHTTNGGDWCRSKQSYLGKKYIIKRSHYKGSISEVKCDGLQKENFAKQNIRPDIQKAITKERCAILDISTNIECDHKDGKKDDSRLNSLEEQQLQDFQPLCKTANMAKKSHCKKCKEEGKRYDAKRLGYSVSFLYGDENTKTCLGCYWYDPKVFNKEISKDFKKLDD